MSTCPVCDFEGATLELISVPGARLGFPSGTLHGIERVRCEEDRRGHWAALTVSGRARFEAARSVHRAGVRLNRPARHRA